MIGYNELNSGFDEDRLPPGQEPIETSSIKRFNMFVQLMTNSKQKTGYSTMGVVTGRAGIGKTIAIQAYLKSLERCTHTSLPPSIQIKVKPNSTPKALVRDLLAGLGERSRGSNRYTIADEAASAILGNDLKLLFVDEADQLNEDGFELLRYIFGKTGCPIVVVGLPQILRVINRHEKFASRVGLRMDFLPLDEDEILKTVLPKLVFPYWTFDQACETDCTMGKEIWAKVKPSLRELRVVLEYASQLTEMRGETRITPTIIALC